jgi:hypothetical protein
MSCRATTSVIRSASTCDRVPGPWTISTTDCRSGFDHCSFQEDSLINRQIGELPRLAKPAAWLKARFDIIKSTCPSFMRPKYFALVIYTAYKAARRAVVEQCSEFISSGHSFTHDLALAAVQQYGLVKSASIDPSKPVPSLAAGLPHFAAGWARCWGRDVVSPFFLLVGRC